MVVDSCVMAEEIVEGTKKLSMAAGETPYTGKNGVIMNVTVVI